MKKTVITVMLVACLLFMAGCDSGNENNANMNNNVPTTQSNIAAATTPTPKSDAIIQLEKDTESLQQDKIETIVYVTKSGTKYHRDGCGYLKKSKIPISLEDAEAKGYTPCSKCNP